MLTNRELATLILLGVLIVLMFAIPKWRKTVVPAFGKVVRAALVPSILAVFGLFLLWCGVWVVLGALLGYWDLSLIKDTVIIVLTVGFPILFRSVNAKSGTAIVRQIGKETVAVSALLFFYLNLEPFPLWVELLVQPLLTFLVMMQFVASREARHKQLHSCLTVVITIAGIGILAWATIQLILGAADRDWVATVRELALSIWLPLVMFPFFYGVTFYAAAQKITRRLRRIYKPPASRRATLAAVLGLHFRLKWAREFVPVYEKPVMRATTFREAWALMRDFREQVVENERLERERVADLEAFAGQVGADGNGAQLDRREFEGTKRALRFIDVAQSMRYERLGNRYWDDLTELVIQPADLYELPTEHGIVVEITADGQRWRAWRRMPSGWHLGIGGRDGAPGHFLYAASAPPSDWPGDGSWTDATWAPELPPDWERDDSPIR